MYLQTLADRLTVTDTRSSLGHHPGQRWQFDQAVSDVFEDMLARSIPQIDGMREVIFRAGARFIQPATDIVDLGCAHGDALAPFLEGSGVTNRFVAVDVSTPMIEACQRRFQDQMERGIIAFRTDDLRYCYPDVRASLTLAVLTFMFTPIEHRFRILADVFNHTIPGGALVIVEKILGADLEADKLLVDLYYEHKTRMGYTEAEIDQKRRSLEGVLVPVTAAWNEQMLAAAGFQCIECIWRCLNFCAWIAVRG